MHSSNPSDALMTPTLDHLADFYRSEFNTEVGLDRMRGLLIVDSRTPYGTNPVVLRRQVVENAVVLQVDLFGIAQFDRSNFDSLFEGIDRANGCGIPGVLLPIGDHIIFRQYVAIQSSQAESWQDRLRYMLYEGLTLSAGLHGYLNDAVRGSQEDTASATAPPFNDFDARLN